MFKRVVKIVYIYIYIFFFLLALTDLLALPVVLTVLYSAENFADYGIGVKQQLELKVN